MKRIYSCFFLFFLLSFCSEKSTEDNIITAPVEEDYSNISNPLERWRAYNLDAYVLDEHIACNCPPPTGVTAIIIDNEVSDVEFELSKDQDYGRTRDEIKTQMMHFAMTVDEAFEFVESYTDAQKMEVDYDPRYGFPSRIFVDDDTMVIDDEYTRTFSNLEKIIE